MMFTSVFEVGAIFRTAHYGAVASVEAAAST